MKGRYANMWRKQIRAERAAEAASQMVAKANALQKAVMDRPGSSGVEGGVSEDVSENEGESRGSTTLAPSLASKAPVRPAEGLHDGGSSTQAPKTSDFMENDKSDGRNGDQNDHNSKPHKSTRGDPVTGP